MLTILLPTRFRDNPDNNIHNFLTSLIKHGGTSTNCEILIKLDNDDFNDVKNIKLFQQYDLNIRLFIYERGEGRHVLHNYFEYLYLQRNPNSRFILVGSDDFTFTRQGFIGDILNRQDKYCCVGPWRGLSIEIFKQIDYTSEYGINLFKFVGSSLPCISISLLNILGGSFGFHSNVDNWITLINIIMYKKYGINLWRKTLPFFNRESIQNTCITCQPNLYSGTVIDGSDNKVTNPHYMKLVEQQCKNIYLNIIADLIK